MKEKYSGKNLLSIISLFASLLVFAVAGVIYLYSNGWRFNIFDRSVLKTGVLTVESEPFLADIYIDGVAKGRTPKSMSLPVGVYNIRVHRDGYHDWVKDVEVKEEKSTPVIPWLIKENINKENAFTLSSENYINSWMNETSDHILLLTSVTTSSNSEYTYKLWRYDINRTFWDLDSNPKVVFTYNTKSPYEFDLLLSPSGKLAILTVKNEDGAKRYFLDTNKVSSLSTLKVLPIDSFASYNITWSKDNGYLMFESDSELISFDIERHTKYLLFKKSPERRYIWTTDAQGYFYHIETNPNYTDNENVYAYVLNQTEMDGSSPKVLLNDLFFQKNSEYIKEYQDDDTSENRFSYFKNSPESTKTVGDINHIQVNQAAKGIFISTDSASYWYSMGEGKYILISPNQSSFVQFSNDNFKLIYKDTSGYGLFTFNKETNDHTMEVGGKVIKDIKPEATNVMWLSNSSYIYYVEDNNLFVADKDGDNKVLLLENIDNNKFTGITYTKENVFSLMIISSDKAPDSVSIDKYLIH